MKAAVAVKPKAPAPAAAPAPEVRRKPAGTPHYVRASGLVVGGVHDPEEHEAERASRNIVAGGVHRVADPAAAGRIRRVTAPRVADPAAEGRVRRAVAARVEDPGGHVRRRPGDGRPPTASAAALVATARGAPARPLAPPMRGKLEQGLGADLGGVRVQTGPAAGAAAAAIGARAYTEGSHITLGRGESEHDLGLMAHEATHVVQNQGAPAPIRRLGLDDVLDYLADKANLIPGYRMFTIVLGVNPINMAAVARTTANVLRAIVDFLPGGDLIVQALDRYGVFDKAGAWIDGQIDSLGISAGSIIDAVKAFVGSLGVTDVFSPGDVWDRAKRIFTDPIGRIIDFVVSIGGAVLDLLRDAVLKPIAGLASSTRGWDLVCAVLGHNPITGEAVERTADTLIGGFMKLIGKEEVWANAKRANAGARLMAWFEGAIGQLLGFVSRIPQLFLDALHAFKIEDLLDLPGAFGRVIGVFGDFIGSFISWAGETVWHLLEIIFDVVSPGALVYIKKTGAALRAILADPLPFVGNLARAAKLGFQNFAGNFPAHLKTGLVDWLTGSLPGVYIPKAFTLAEIAHFILSILGITWQNLRSKLVKAVGEPAVKAMETGFEIVMTLVTKGPAAAWEQIKEHLGQMRDTVLQGIMDFVIDAVVTRGIPKLVSLFIPGAGFVSAILSIYDMIIVIKNKIAKIVAVVTGFVDSMVAIAAGSIGPAAERVEGALASGLSVAISLVAGLVGLGSVADKVMGVIQRVRAVVDGALDKVIGWIVAMAKKLFAKAFGKDPKDDRTDAQKQGDLARGVSEARGLLDRPGSSPEAVRKQLPAIKLKYKMAALDLVIDGSSAHEETVHVHGVVNPTLESPPAKIATADWPVAVGDKIKAPGSNRIETVTALDADWITYSQQDSKTSVPVKRNRAAFLRDWDAGKIGRAGDTADEKRAELTRLYGAEVANAVMHRGDLADNVGILNEDQAHHIIPVKIWGRTTFLLELIKGGWDPNEAANGIALAEGFHGSHPAYTNYVTAAIGRWVAANGELPLADAIVQFRGGLLADLRSKINAAKAQYARTGLNLNDYFANLP